MVHPPSEPQAQPSCQRAAAKSNNRDTVVLIRSIIFNCLFYLNLMGYLIAALPTLAMPRWGIIGVAKLWGRSSLWLLRFVCGTRTEFIGLDRIPAGPLLVACKHQSLWETFALLPVLSDPAYI